MADPVPAACPFDGYASPLLETYGHTNQGLVTYRVHCPVCRNSSVPHTTKQGAVDDWGARATPATPTYVTWLAAFAAWQVANPPTADIVLTNLFGSTVPGTPDSGDATGIEIGVAFKVLAAGLVTGARFYKSTLNTGTHVGNLWDLAGTNLAAVTFTGETSSGWQEATFSAPVTITPGTYYIVSVYCPNGHYAASSEYFATDDFVHGILTAPATGNVTIGNGRFLSGSGFPVGTFNATNYWVDAIVAAYAPTYTTWEAALAAWLVANPPIAD